MKRILAILLVMALSLSMLTACGGDDKKKSKPASSGGNEGGSSSSSAFVDKTGDLTYSIAERKDASIDLGGLYVTDSMVDKSIQTKGSAQRVASAFERASAGEKITIAYVGSEISKGDGASSEDKSYAGLVSKWISTTFPSAKVEVVNIGVRNGGSIMASALSTTEVIPLMPDIVIIETGIHDNDANDYEYFESMVRDYLGCASDPAVLILGTCGSGYNSDAKNQGALTFKYNLPFINCAAVIENNIKNGTWKWTDIGVSADSSFYNDKGHAFLAHVVTGYFSKVLDGVAESSYARYTMPDQKLTKCRMSGVKFVPATDCSPSSDDGNFAKSKIDDKENRFFKSGYSTTKADTAKFTVKAKNIAIVVYQSSDGENGAYDVNADKEGARSVSSGVAAAEDGSTFTQIYTEPLIQSDKEAKHTVTCKYNAEKSKTEETTNEGFTVLGFIIN